MLHPETRHGGDRRSDQATKLVTRSATSFVDATAQATGMSPTSIRRVVARGDALGDDL